MKSVRLHAAARRELDEAAQFYESKQPGLGKRWLEAVGAAEQKIRRDPRIGRPAVGSIRKCRVDSFPYDIYFENLKDCI